MSTHAPQSTKTIVLIHGLWMTPLSWEHWVERYSAAGYDVHTPAWPGLDKPVDEIRANASALGGLGVGDIVDSYDKYIRNLDEQPIIIGHSFGGLVTEMLIDCGLGVAGIPIDAAPAQGVLNLPLSALRVAGYGLRTAKPSGVVELTQSQFQYAFTNTMSDAETKAAYERYYVPGPTRPLFQAAFANFNPKAATKVHWSNTKRAPLLLIGGSKDHTVPAAITHAQYKLYTKHHTAADIKVFEGRPHFLCGAPGWEEVCDYALEWANSKLNSGARP